MLSVAIRYSDETRSCTELIAFEDVIAFRFRDEMHSRGYYNGSYDTIVEVVDSAWLAELLAIEPSRILGGVRGKRHFAVFFSNTGYLEIIAAKIRHGEPSPSPSP